MKSFLSRVKAFPKIDIGSNRGKLQVSFKRNLATEVSTAQPAPKKPVTDFLLNHGGKVALVAFSISAYLIYTYYLSVTDRKNVEEDVEHSTIIEPYEIQQLRYANRLSKDAFLSIAKRVYEDNSATVNRGGHNKLTMTYKDFVKLVQQHSSQHHNPISNGYFLDRVVYQHMIQPQLHSLIFRSEEECALSNGTTKWYEMELPVDYLLVVLSLALESDAPFRLAVFHQLLQDYSCSSTDQNNNNKANNVSKEDVLRLAQLFQLTDQIPPEKQVVETGVKYPVKLHRRKTPEDMLELYKKSVVSKAKEKSLTTENLIINWNDEQEFKQFFTNYNVCVWGSCYHGR